MLTARKVLGVKLETTYKDGTTIPTAAANAILVEDLAWDFADVQMHQRNALKNTGGALGDLYAGSLIQITGKFEIRGSGTAGTPPEADPIYQCSGLDHVNVPVTSDTYSPKTSGHASAAAYLWEDGLVYKVTGCRGAPMRLVADAGKPGMVEFTLKGHFAGPTDEALPSPTYDAAVPVVANGMGFTVDSYAASISGLSVDFGGQFGTPSAVSEADGYGEIHIVPPRRVTGSFDPLATLVATYDWVAKWKANNAASMTTGVIGSTAGNRWQLTLPQTQYLQPGNGDNNGVLKREIQFLAQESSGDDEFSLVFT